MMLKSFTLLVAMLATPHAHAVDKRAPGKSFCSKVNKAVTSLRQQSLATAFCSSYLHIPLSTVNSASTTTIVAATSTSVVTSTESTGTVSEATKTTTVTAGTTTTTVDGLCPRTKKKRATQNTSKLKPNCLNTYTGGGLSSACSCLSIAPSTTTIGRVVKTTSTPVTTSTSTTTISSDATTTTTSTVTVPKTTATETTQPTNCAPVPIVKDDSFEACGQNPNNCPWQFTENSDVAGSNQNAQAPDGNAFASLIATKSESSGSFQQNNVALTGTSTQWTLAFYYRIYQGASPGTCTLAATYNSQAVFTLVYGNSGMSFQPASFSFNAAPGTVSTLQFTLDCANSPQNLNTVLIDQVSITGN